MLVEKRLGLEEANRVIEAVIAAAQERGSQLAVVIVDQHGDFIAGCRMDGRPYRFMKAAWRKAYSAAAFDMDTSGIIKFWDRQQSEGHRGPSDWNDPMLTTLPGGMAILHGDKMVGGIAVAGGGGGEGKGDWDYVAIGLQALGEGFTHLETMHRYVPEYDA